MLLLGLRENPAFFGYARIVARRTGSIDVAIPASGAVAPTGPSLLFVTNRASDGTRVPSVGAAIEVEGGAELRSVG